MNLNAITYQPILYHVKMFKDVTTTDLLRINSSTFLKPYLKKKIPNVTDVTTGLWRRYLKAT